MKFTNILIVMPNKIQAHGIKNILKENFPDAFIQIVYDINDFYHKINSKIIYELVIFDPEFTHERNGNFIFQFASLYPNINIILLHTKLSYLDIKKYLKHGINSLLLKPINSSNLIKSMDYISQNKIYLDPHLTQKLLQYYGSFKNNSSQLDQKNYISFSKNYQSLISELSHRESEILNLIADALSSKEISEKLEISPNTVETHRRSILKKLGAKNTAEIVRIFVVAQMGKGLMEV